MKMYRFEADHVNDVALFFLKLDAAKVNPETLRVYKDYDFSDCIVEFECDLSIYEIGKCVNMHEELHRIYDSIEEITASHKADYINTERNY